MRRTTAILYLPSLSIGIIVTTYWLIAFWAALTTPIYKGPPIPHPWEFIDLFRDPGLRLTIPLLFDDCIENPLILYLRKIDWRLSLSLVAFTIGIATGLIALIITKIVYCLTRKFYRKNSRLVTTNSSPVGIRTSICAVDKVDDSFS